MIRTRDKGKYALGMLSITRRRSNRDGIPRKPRKGDAHLILTKLIHSIYTAAYLSVYPSVVHSTLKCSHTIPAIDAAKRGSQKKVKSSQSK